MTEIAFKSKTGKVLFEATGPVPDKGDTVYKDNKRYRVENKAYFIEDKNIKTVLFIEER